MTIANGLAGRIHNVRYDTLPEDALHWARVAILDTVGVTLAGASEPCARIAARVLTGGGSIGPSLIFGSDRRAAPLDAAMINGTAAHALDFDDCSNTLGGHPSAPILPALFALAETLEVDGRAFLAAYIAGFETEARISRGINFHHYEKGWHPTATIGTFGAAAACAHLLGLPADRTAAASIERIDAWTHPRRLAHTNRPDPNSALDAKFSVQYCLARAALDRQVTLAHFTGDAHRDPEVRAMLACIRAAPHPEMSMASTDHFGGEVRITLKDGRVLSRRVNQPIGRDADHPLPPDLLEAKFLTCATSALAPDTARHLLTLLWRLDDIPRIIHLTAAMLPAHRAAV